MCSIAPSRIARVSWLKGESGSAPSGAWRNSAAQNLRLGPSNSSRVCKYSAKTLFQFLFTFERVKHAIVTRLLHLAIEREHDRILR